MCFIPTEFPRKLSHNTVSGAFVTFIILYQKLLSYIDINLVIGWSYFRILNFKQILYINYIATVLLLDGDLIGLLGLGW